MNRRRCPWCGKRIDKNKDKIFWQDVIPGYSMLHTANCAHCGRKYGQIPLFSYVWRIGVVVLLILSLAFVFQSGLLLFVAVIPCVGFLFMPYSKLDDKGRYSETNTDLFCKIKVIEKYKNIKRDDIYFLNDSFDNLEPFVDVSPINIYYVPKKGDIVLGEFLYMNEKNLDFIEKDSCNLYDTEMNLIARIKFDNK